MAVHLRSEARRELTASQPFTSRSSHQGNDLHGYVGNEGGARMRVRKQQEVAPTG